MRKCFFCRRDLPSNDVLEHFRHGRRVAYDPWRGRLWAVCDGCRRWMLAPLDARWEALEELERAVRDRGRVLVRTDNIALVRVGALDVIRVGEAGRREEAWWRFGEAMAGRARKAKSIARAGRFFDGALMLALIGIPYWGWSDAGKWIDRARRRSFGRAAWRAPLPCPHCGAALRSIDFAERSRVRVLTDDAGEVMLWRGCERCGSRADAGHRIAGPPAEHLMRRFLAYHNFAGASRDDVGRAAALIEGHASAGEFVRSVAARGPALGHLGPDQSLALEIASHDAREHALLAGELDAIEARWREEERIAAIVDGELS